MSPILDSIGSVKGYGWGAIFSTNSFESIATYTVGSGGSSTITFSSIPSTYKHLQMRYIARDTTATNDVSGIVLRFNSDSGTNYTRHYLIGDGSSASAGAATNSTSIVGGLVVGGGMTASAFAAAIIDVLDYTDTNKYKTYRVLTGNSTNSSTTKDYVDFESALWRSTSAVTSITITLPSGNYAQYSHFALYGIKG